MPSIDLPEMVLAAHLPLVHIDDDSVPFAGGDLWRMPFDAFDALTLGAFDRHRAAYEAQAPVFYRLVVQPSRPLLVPLRAGATGSRRLQLKLSEVAPHAPPHPIVDWIASFRRHAVRPAWQALLLGHPDAALPMPDLSVTFAVADEGWGVEVGDDVIRISSVQGDADLDYLLAGGFQTACVSAQGAANASDWAVRLGDRMAIDPILWPAIDALCACSSPLLGTGDRGALATAALEALLLPDARSDLARMLARRVAALLGGRDAAVARSLQSRVRALYEARSATVHGEVARADATVDPACGPPLLAAAIRALDGAARAAAASVAALVERLDETDAAIDVDAPPDMPRPLQPPLLRARVGVSAVVGTHLASRDGHWALWAPLAGLHCTEPLSLDGTADQLLLPLTGAEVLSLEERDVARDFPAQLMGVGEHLAALCLQLAETEAPTPDTAFEQLSDRRDLAVTALRLAGFHDFVDPELAGPVLMRGPVRLRRPSVLRAAVWQRFVDESRAVPIGRTADAARLGTHMQRLLALARRPHADLSRAASLYRKGFDRRFTDATTAAMLHFAALECLLGRFGRPGQPDGLEALVVALLGPHSPAALWFAAHGRRTRNALAHGRADDAWPCELPGALAAVLGAALPRAVDLWLDDTASSLRPGPRLVRSLLAAAD